MAKEPLMYQRIGFQFLIGTVERPINTALLLNSQLNKSIVKEQIINYFQDYFCLTLCFLSLLHIDRNYMNLVSFFLSTPYTFRS